MRGKARGAVQGLPGGIDLSVGSLPARCVQLVEDQVGFSVLWFSSCSLNSAFFLMLPGQPAAWVCVPRSLTGVSLLVEAQEDDLLLFFLFPICFETWKRQEQAWAAGG